MLFLINIELIGPLSLEFFLFPVLKLENICLLHLPSSSPQFSIFSWKNNSSVISLHTLHTPSSTELVVTFVELKSCTFQEYLITFFLVIPLRVQSLFADTSVLSNLNAIFQSKMMKIKKWSGGSALSLSSLNITNFPKSRPINSSLSALQISSDSITWLTIKWRVPQKIKSGKNFLERYLPHFTFFKEQKYFKKLKSTE